ncbi:MAG TPA: hypothetical protein VFC25_16210 [Verrucomicrobiae bacterium]|nr:hypothetical protein [Verrucomicrobiae bacterium]
MPEAASLALVPIVFALTVFGPGFLLVRRAGWTPLETATGALALSILLVGLVSFGFGIASVPVAGRAVLLAGCVLATLVAAPAVADVVRRDAEARRALAWFGLLALWGVSLQALVRNYSGGNIVYDWLDHYERAKFFLGWQPVDKLFSGALLTARPPLMNAFAAQLLAVTSSRFAGYQLTVALLGLLAYWPILLVARLFCRPATADGESAAARGLPRTVAIVLMFQPMFLENVSYSWTRMTAVFFVLAAVGFYVEGWRRGDLTRTVFAFVCGAAAILTHYSSAPYILFLALHQLFFVLPARPRMWRELTTIALAGTLVLAPWLTWAGSVYGAGTLLSAGLASSGKPLPTAGANLAKAALNLRDTFVPPLLRDVPRDAGAPGSGWGRLRDEAFLMYQGNLPFALGSLGVVLLVLEALRSRRSRRSRPPAPSQPDPWVFWIALAAFVIVTGIGVQGSREPLGLAHTAQQPLVMIGVAFLASRFGAWPRWLRVLAAAGFLVDACFGVLLQFWLQSYPLDLPSDWRGPLGLTLRDLSLMMAGWNWGNKIGGGHRFVADVLSGAAWIPFVTAAIVFAAGTVALLRLAWRGPEPAAPHS